MVDDEMLFDGVLDGIDEEFLESSVLTSRGFSGCLWSIVEWCLVVVLCPAALSFSLSSVELFSTFGVKAIDADDDDVGKCPLTLGFAGTLGLTSTSASFGFAAVSDVDDVLASFTSVDNLSFCT